MRVSPRSLARSLRRATAPVRWSLVGLYGWSHRHTLALWWRSLAFARRDGLGARDLRHLGRGLAKVTLDRRLANAPEIHHLRLVGDTIEVDVEPGWASREMLATVLGAVGFVRLVPTPPSPVANLSSVPGPGRVAATAP